MLSEITQEELSASLDTIAGEVLAEAGVDRPPVDAVAVAKAMGITVATDNRQPGRARYVRLQGINARRPQPTILVRSEPRKERRHWAVAHEIGEHVAHRVFSILSVNPRETPPNARETVACHLAGRLLLPRDWFSADALACNWDLIALKSDYSTASHELIARRMLDFSLSVIVTIFDHRQISLRRSNLPGRIPPPTSLELDCWRSVHQQNRPHQSSDGPRTVQAWPVHEDGWKREILRTELEIEFWQ